MGIKMISLNDALLTKLKLEPNASALITNLLNDYYANQDNEMRCYNTEEELKAIKENLTNKEHEYVKVLEKRKTEEIEAQEQKAKDNRQQEATDKLKQAILNEMGSDDAKQELCEGEKEGIQDSQ